MRSDSPVSMARISPWDADVGVAEAVGLAAVFGFRGLDHEGVWGKAVGRFQAMTGHGSDILTCEESGWPPSVPKGAAPTA